MSRTEIRVPDLGDFDAVDVIEVHVKAGDRVEKEDPLLTLETDKATMDVPSPVAGVIASLAVDVGGKVSAGDLIGELDAAEAPESSAGTRKEAAGPAAPPQAASGGAGARLASEPGARRAPPPEARTRPDSEPRREPEPPRAASPGGAVASREAAREPAVGPPPAGRRVVVLGAGPGGYTAAFRAADLGLEVTLVDREAALGGVCLNVGCIPSKALLHAARVIEEASEMAERGIAFGAPRIDTAKLRRWKNDVVGQLTQGLAALAKQRRVEVVRGTGRFVSANEIEVEQGGERRRVPFDQCIIAAGSEPTRLPGLPDDPRVMDSTAALELEELPERMLVIGGGIIGLEMATVYDALGVEVSVVELTKTLLPGVDRDLVRPLEKRLRARYAAIMLGTRVVKVEAGADGIAVRFDGDESPAEPQRYGRVLVAVGRRPNGRAIGAEAAGIRVDDRGFVPVDKQMRTNVPHIFAIGDIAGPPMLAHKASHEGRVAAEAAAGRKSFFDARAIPSVAYTDPEVAWTGLTEEQAKTEGVRYEKGVFPWAASGRALSLGRSDGITKLLFEQGTGRVLGAGIVGTNAGDLIAEATLAIEMGADEEDIGLTIHPHPTLSETVAFAAEAAAGTITDLYVPKR
ncbi:MAG TPA: dihydrolipoyl dehydrogenase [Gammaproteobacteria bacterium]|nr:dihydrolipoyl dehydrogenase [Gammaproteobacteria bacterium]